MSVKNFLTQQDPNAHCLIIACPLGCINLCVRNSGELEQFKAMDRLISRCEVRQCSQMQPGVRVRERRRSRATPFSHFHIIILTDVTVVTLFRTGDIPITFL